MSIFWPFEAYGKDINGKIYPPSSNNHSFILHVMAYFSKWEEAIPLAEVKTLVVSIFLRTYIIYRLGVPKHIYHDNIP